VEPLHTANSVIYTVTSFWTSQYRKSADTAIPQNNSLHTAILQEGGVEIFGFADLANFWFGFRNQTLRFFSFDVLCGLLVFSNSVFGFRFVSAMMAVFSDFSVNCILRFFWFCQGSYTLQSSYITSLVSLI